MMAQLAGRIALVTGAGRGIGPVIARRLAQDGATIIANYANSRAGAEQVVDEVNRNGGTATALKADLRQRAEILRMFEQIDSSGGRVDILINCAGISASTPLLKGVDEDVIQTLIGVNLLAPYYLAVESVRRMPSGGRIVNFSSSVARFPFPGGSIYAGAKAAVENFTKVWAKELGAKGITVNTVIPGATSPGMMDNSPEYRAFFEKASPFGRIGRAEEVAAVVAFLCSPEASWVSGAEILVNGAGSA